MITIQIYIKTKDLKSHGIIDLRKTREGVFDTHVRQIDPASLVAGHWSLPSGTVVAFAFFGGGGDAHATEFFGVIFTVEEVPLFAAF
jgi:hypothetical protein